jgi:CubicO group peptidase (beta-lactamase class C family)
MSKRRIETWLALFAAAVGLLLVAIGSLWVYSSATAPVLHPNPQDVPSVSRPAPGPKWAGAVKQAQQIVRTTLAEKNLPGLSVAVGIGGEIEWAEGFGFADLEKKVTVAPDTRFRIGSASTVLTSAAVGRLLEQGKLNLDDPIQKHVPEFPDHESPVTLRQVMAHVAGIPSDGGDEGELFSQHCDRPADALPFFAKRALRFAPGTEYRYSNYGWILVSAAVEAAAGEPFLTVMHDEVFERLGMHDTVPDTTSEAAAPDRATSYFPRFASDPRYGPDLMRELDFSCYAGASVFLSTPSDLVRFAMAINGSKLLQPATVQLLQTSQRLPDGKETGYGLGWDLETVTIAGKEMRTVGHDGDVLGGTAASLLTFPEQGLAIALTSNTSYADTFAIAVKIAQAFVAQRNTPAGK